MCIGGLNSAEYERAQETGAPAPVDAYPEGERPQRGGRPGGGRGGGRRPR